MSMKIILLCCSALVLFTNNGEAQKKIDEEEIRDRYGAFIHINFNNHRADFRALPGVPNCCPQFTDGSGTGFTTGILYETPVSKSFLFDIRAAYATHNALLKKTEPITVSVGGIATPGSFEHSIDTKLSSFGLEPMLLYKLFGKLSFIFGTRASLLLKKSFDQKETLLEPFETGTFENGKRVRNEFTGEIPNVNSFQSALLLGGSYEFPFNSEKTVLGALEFIYSIGITKLVQNLSWYMNTIRLGVAVKLSPKKENVVEAVPPQAEVDKPEEKPVLQVQANIYAIDLNGKEITNPKIHIEEFTSTQLHPLLNYVFFDENSSVIHPRYVQLQSEATKNFWIDSLHHFETLPIYYQILNIIGRRMIEHPKAKITLTGCNSDEGLEKGNIKLSRTRADCVRDYFRNVWNIADSRMKIEARNLPQKYSYPTDADGIVENRRVEIHSDTWEIIEPVETNNSVINISPAVIKIKPRITAPDGVKDWSVNYYQGSRMIQEIRGNGNVPPEINWNMEKDQITNLSSNESVVGIVQIHDSYNQSERSKLSAISVERLSVQQKEKQRLADRIIDRYNLILFDFDKDDLNSINKKVVGIIQQKISTAANIEITGYTDRMGDNERNLRLAEGRARSTADQLGFDRMKASGKGEVLLFNNDLPEGRFYNRTVEIVVETPIDH